MRRVLLAILVIGAVAGVAVYTQRDREPKATAAERHTCQALRDVMTAITTRSSIDEWNRTIDALTPAANRTENAVLMANATTTRQVWNDWERSPRTQGPTGLTEPLFAMSDECNRLGVHVADRSIASTTSPVPSFLQKP